MFLQRDRGFFSIHFAVTVGILFFGLSMYALLYYFQSRAELFNQICYVDLKEAYAQFLRSEQSVLRLNPLSTALRLNIARIRLALAAAVTSGNGPLAAALTAELARVRYQQVQLDSLQKSLLLGAQQSMRSRIDAAETKVKTDHSAWNAVWKNYVSSRHQLGATFIGPALKPDSIGGVGPNYELLKSYERLQSVSFRLHLESSLGKPFGGLRNQINEYRCFITAQQKGNSWKLRMNPDKFL